ncbi:DUF2924 domain-containing protein [Histidinibacterium aquaticum]|uniref:DUF2924 domain-containing protein n=1 Tax=Histidinibacterium aquaticum TaxID=2613962 RepID=A0A5J5GKL8_9RHOB|nr:DUF2924 domain-containing protein [Histidinibacterium aquaticum]KAA9008745.1 DUF2924 domain-containing protein [Histidinibacterium aquaticum]
MEVAEIETMDRAALVAAWVHLFEKAPPRGISQPVMRRFLAFESQARQRSGLSRKVQAALSTPTAPNSEPRRRDALKPGGRLLREWNGVTHVVDVLETGYRWNGQTWRSLSAIAREITGAHWSGPRFFGLRAKARR